MNIDNSLFKGELAKEIDTIFKLTENIFNSKLQTLKARIKECKECKRIYICKRPERSDFCNDVCRVNFNRSQQ